jgi:transcriptional regulator with XRE-family HTH domain
MENKNENLGSNTNENDVKIIFAKRIKELREENGFGVRELAARLGISHASISNYETLKRTPDIDICRIYAKFFNVKGDYLLGITDEKR